MTRLNFRTREEAFNFLDSYALTRKQEIDRRRLSKDSGFIKSYTFETAADHSGQGITPIQLQRSLSPAHWKITPVDDGFFRVDKGQETLGFVDIFSERHFVLHTFAEARQMDIAIQNLVRGSSELDFTWFAGNYLNLIWETYIRENMPHRFVSFKFEHESRFENGRWADSGQEDYGISELDETTLDDETAEVHERRASTLRVNARVNKVAQVLPQLQNVLPDFKAIKMLRIPAYERPGGYEFWDWGKVTYRSPSFRDGRDYLYQITAHYQEATEIIEGVTWFQAEKTNLHDGAETITLTGAPITFTFPEPIEMPTFQNFIITTFEKNRGPLRLWGNPIWLDERKVHVYGVDLHLWQRIYLELTPSRFVLVLPKGTCGNTVHRLISNIQRYISPEVQTHIGNYRYEDIVRNVLLNRTDQYVQ